MSRRFAINPQTIVLGIRPMPFGELNALYTYILTAVEHIETVFPILAMTYGSF